MIQWLAFGSRKLLKAPRPVDWVVNFLVARSIEKELQVNPVPSVRACHKAKVMF